MQLIDQILDTDGESGAEKMPGLRGKWVVAMKVQIVLGYIGLAFGVPWAAWITQDAIANETFRSSGDRFTQLDARDLEDRQRIARDARFGQVEARLGKLEQDMARAVTILERVEANTRRIGQ